LASSAKDAASPDPTQISRDQAPAFSTAVHIAYQKLEKTIQNLLHTGELDGEKAFIISQEPDVDRQRELAKLSAGLSRDELRQRARRTCNPDQSKSKRAVFVLPSLFKNSLP
jgi:DNA-binding phage protein